MGSISGSPIIREPLGGWPDSWNSGIPGPWISTFTGAPSPWHTRGFDPRILPVLTFFFPPRGMWGRPPGKLWQFSKGLVVLQKSRGGMVPQKYTGELCAGNYSGVVSRITPEARRNISFSFLSPPFLSRDTHRLKLV